MSTDTTILFILSNVSTACIVGTISLAALEIWKRQKRDDFAEAAENRAEAAKTWLAVTESREHFFAFAPQPQQQHAQLDSAPVLPALSDQSHEDEQAPAEDDDHAGAWWLPLMVGPKLLARLVGWLIGLAEVAYERLAEAVAEMRQSWQTRNEVGNGDGVREVLAASGYDLRTDEDIAAELATLTGEPVAVEIAEIREVDGRKQVRAAHWNDGTAVHTTVYVGRRRKADA